MIDYKKIDVSIYPNEIAQYDRIARLKLNLDLEVQQADGTITSISRSYEVKVTVPAGAYVAYASKDVGIIDTDNSSIQKYLTSYTTCLETEKTSKGTVDRLEPEIENLKTAIKMHQDNFDKIKEYKRQLNELFF
jgi:prefoldin subunit 5